jgi:hypothetical protein
MKIKMHGSGEVILEKPLELANLEQIERTCANTQPTIDPESIERFCRTWAEVGQAILARRRIRQE